LTVSASDERRLAVASADGTCPRCGTGRAADQRYCLECGFALPVVVGRIPALRRRWIARVGWYPGDWIWAALPTFLIAAAGAAAAIAVTDHRRSEAPSFATAPAAVSLAQPASPVSTAPQTVGTSKLPTAPEPTTAARNGRTVWPANENGWTIVLVSYPKGFGRPQAAATAARAAKAGLGQVGIVDSSRYASLQPGYYVVFTGIYGSKADADAAVATAKQAGFPGAYSREIAG
jgi:SPOR domain